MRCGGSQEGHAGPVKRGNGRSRPAARKSFSKPFAVARPHGFTLIELLVVIAVIALLMALFMPSLQRVLVACG